MSYSLHIKLQLLPKIADKMTTVLILLSVATTCLGGHLGELASYHAEERYIADTILSRDFDKNTRPPGLDSQGAHSHDLDIDAPTRVTINMYIMELGLCPEHQEVTVGGYFRQNWDDPRLAIDLGNNGNNNTGGVTTLKFRDMFEDRKIWIPDTFIPGDKFGFVSKVKAETGGRSFAKVKCCGSVKTSMKIRTQSLCVVPKNAEEVSCQIAFESYGHQADEITYEWKKDEVQICDKAKAMSKAKGWELVKMETKSSTVSLSTGAYSRGVLMLDFKKVDGDD